MRLIPHGGTHHRSGGGGGIATLVFLRTRGGAYALAGVFLLCGGGAVAGEGEEAMAEASDADAENTQGKDNVSLAKLVEVWHERFGSTHR